MHYQIDLNSDMGESFGAYKLGNDAEIIQYVTSANIACGWHAGDPMVMDRTVKAAATRGVAVGAHGEYAFPVALYAVWAIKGFGMALVHNCSFPMVVELCSSKKIGKFTGYYYTASMSAQTVTPILLGFLFDMTGAWRALPIYACVMTTLSAIVFISLVKNIKAKKVANVVGIEALDSGD